MLKFGDVAEQVTNVIQPEEALDLPYIGLEHIEQNSLHLGGIGVAKDVISSKLKFEKGDILFGKLRPYFRKVIRAPFDGICSTDIWVVRARKGTDQTFLYYWMASPEFIEEATRGAEGTKMPRAKWDYISRFQSPIGNYNQQVSIGEVLSVLDKKIELNRRMNESLENIAEALFKSWFVDFDLVKAEVEGRKPEGLDEAISALFPSSFTESPLGPIPHGWEVRRLDKITEIQGGFAFKGKDFINAGNPVIKIRNINSNGSVNSLDVDFVSDEVASKAQKFLLDDGDLLMAMTGATVGKFGLLVNSLGKKCLLNQRVARFIPNNQEKPWFIYTALSHEPIISRIINTALGSAQANISSDGIGRTELVLPDSKVIHAFNCLVDSSFKKIIALRKEINYLSQLRDTLLPKLIAGELRVSEISETVQVLAS